LFSHGLRPPYKALYDNSGTAVQSVSVSA
jgi:hypothetical protein